jgi:hypothetical protein
MIKDKQCLNKNNLFKIASKNDKWKINNELVNINEIKIKLFVKYK